MKLKPVSDSLFGSNLEKKSLRQSWKAPLFLKKIKVLAVLVSLLQREGGKEKTNALA